MELIGKGSYSIVFLNKEKNVVTKISHLYDYQNRTAYIDPSILTEIIMLKSLQQIPRIPKLLYVDFLNKVIHEKMEYCGVTLTKWISDVSEDIRKSNILNIITQLAQICKSLMDNGYQHTDIKPTNILINPETLKVTLIDFNLGSVLTTNTFQQSKWSMSIGTWAYIAPEILTTDCPSNNSMVWSIGMTLGYLYYGGHPIYKYDQYPKNETPDSWIETIEKLKELYPDGLILTEDPDPFIASVYNKCLQYSPSIRANLEYILCINEIPLETFVPKMKCFGKNKNPIRTDALQLMKGICIRTNTIDILCRSIGLYDLLSYSYFFTDIIGCLYISYSINYSTLPVEYLQGFMRFIKKLFGDVNINDITLDVIRRLNCDCYFIPLDVLTMQYSNCKLSCFEQIMCYRLLEKQTEPYYLEQLAFNIFLTMASID